jgi:hypothetical protein
MHAALVLGTRDVAKARKGDIPSARRRQRQRHLVSRA